MASRAAVDPPVDIDTKWLMVAEAAYYCAQKRGFEAGHDLDDWLEAEAQIDTLVRR